MAVRSDFIHDTAYVKHGVDDIPMLMIVDLDRGGMSVTNDIENVLADLQIRMQEKGLNLRDMAIIYQDSMKHWDGIKVDRDNKFVGFEHLSNEKDFRTVQMRAAGRFKRQLAAREPALLKD